MANAADPVIPFDPLQFFNKTASYASQGRGHFAIPAAPSCLSNVPWPENLRTGVLVKSFNIPTFQLGTYEPFSYNGPTTKHAYGQIFTDIDVEFLLMGESLEAAQDIYNIFHRWQNAIAGTNTDNYNWVQSTAEVDTFAVSYYDTYITEALLKVYSQSGQPVIEMKLFELYPVAINSIQTSWESPDAPMSFTVTFTFYYPVITKLIKPYPKPPSRS